MSKLPRCVETNKYGDQCVLVLYHTPNGDSSCIDDYDLSFTHRTARSAEAFTWEGAPNTCLKRECVRDEGHQGECREKGWLAPTSPPRSVPAKTQAPVTSAEHEVPTPAEACELAIKFISGLDLRRDAATFQRAQHVVRELMVAIEPGSGS